MSRLPRENMQKRLAFMKKHSKSNKKLILQIILIWLFLTNNIGLVYKNMCEYSKALSYYEKALEIQQETLPTNHPDLAASYNNIGTAYCGMGKYPEALSYYERALKIFQSSLPPNHPSIKTRGVTSRGLEGTQPPL
jgi:tetratricopeptide (TPR) repeat protein